MRRGRLRRRRYDHTRRRRCYYASFPWSQLPTWDKTNPESFPPIPFLFHSAKVPLTETSQSPSHWGRRRERAPNLMTSSLRPSPMIMMTMAVRWWWWWRCCSWKEGTWTKERKRFQSQLWLAWFTHIPSRLSIQPSLRNGTVLWSESVCRCSL